MNMFIYFYKRWKACNFHVDCGKFINVISKSPKSVRKHKTHIKSPTLFTHLPKLPSQPPDLLRTSEMSFNSFGFFQSRKKTTEEWHDRNDMTKLSKLWKKVNRDQLFTILFDTKIVKWIKLEGDCVLYARCECLN